jgi:phosphatidylglycerophosphate synthase
MSERGAVVLATPVAGAAPTERLAGVPLVLRAVLTVQKQKVGRIVVVTSDAEREGVARACADPRVKVPVEVIVAASNEEGERTAAATLGGPIVTARYDEIAAAGATVAVRDDAGKREAVRLLFEACRKSVDGVVSRHLNRHVSIFVSKRIVNTSITPNAISVINFFLGVAAAASVAVGGYLPMLVGAVLFQLNSILDGVDGELARVRFQGSKLGEWLDTISDDVCNVMFYAGLGLGCRAMGLEMLSWMGFAAAGLGIFTSALYYLELVQLGAGDFYALSAPEPQPGVVGAVVRFFTLVLKKDFFILLFTVMALFGVLPWAAAVALLGTSITAINAISRTVRWTLRRRPA